MLNALYEKLGGTGSAAVLIICVAVMLMGGFLMTRLTKRLKLPNVTGYILAGILLGPFCLNLVPANVVAGMDFIADIALAFIAFSTGEFFRFSTLKKNGLRIIWITMAESLVASLFVFVATYLLLGLSLSFSVILAALAAATAPASTVVTIRQTGARGTFVDTLLQVVALDDVVGLIAFSVAVSVASASSGAGRDAWSVIAPILINFGVLLLGAGFGWLLKIMMFHRSTDNRLIVSIASLFAFCGICTALGASPLLGCMSMGTVYINLTEDEKLFRQLNYFSPPILLLFFVRSGLNFRLDALFDMSSSAGSVPLIVVGVVYFAVRIAGKYAGAYLGCASVHAEKRVRNWLGLALIPQAGVAIGLAAMGARILGAQAGAALETVILSSSVLYELIGPGCAKLSLYLSGSYSNRLDDVVPIAQTAAAAGEKTAPVEKLIEQIAAIQKELPRRTDPVTQEEAAFLEAAEEQYAMSVIDRRHRRR